MPTSGTQEISQDRARRRRGVFLQARVRVRGIDRFGGHATILESYREKAEWHGRLSGHATGIERAARLYASLDRDLLDLQVPDRSFVRLAANIFRARILEGRGATESIVFRPLFDWELKPPTVKSVHLP
jgi:hypothetical protein